MTKAMREMVLRIGSLESDVRQLKEKNEELTKLVRAQNIPKPQGSFRLQWIKALIDSLDFTSEKRFEQEPQKTTSVNTLYASLSVSNSTRSHS